VSLHDALTFVEGFITAICLLSISQTIPRIIAAMKRRGHQVPQPADYCEGISEDYLNAIDKYLAHEFEGETFEIVSGPAW
jgi:hypothetical protein